MSLLCSRFHGTGKPTRVETNVSGACRCYATIAAVCCCGVSLDAREGRCGYHSYNNMHKARGQLMTCRRVF